MKTKSGATQILLVLFIALSAVLSAQNSATGIPEGFVDAKEFIPNLRTDLRYYGSNNFVGEP